MTQARETDVQASPRARTQDVLWLVRLRWVAIVTTSLAATAGIWLEVVETGAPLLLVCGGLAASNAFWEWSARRPSKGHRGSTDGAIFFQLLLDLLALALLLYFAGGIENPFVTFFAFHMAIGGILLPRRLAWRLAIFAAVTHGAFVLEEAAGALPHHPLRWEVTEALGLPVVATLSRFESPVHVAGYLVSFWLMIGGVLLFIRVVRERQRRAEARELEHDRVARSRERLARVGEVFAGVAHTIRNPLHGVMNTLEFLESNPSVDDSSRDEMLALQREGLQRIEKITRRLLVLARGDAVERTPTDVAGLLRDVMRSVEMSARTTGVTLNLQATPLPEVGMDPDRVGEALINLLDNAIDACPHGGTVTVRAEVHGEPSPTLRVEVADTGHGIAPEHLERLFDPFFTTKPVGKGSGLGLAIAKRVAEDHEGEIEVESRVGVGTRVRFQLPLVGPRAIPAEAE